MEKIVISLGGSVLLADEIDETFFRKLKHFLKQQHDKKIFIVVGGGPPAREYINKARKLQVPEPMLDKIGIAITRVNALFLTFQLLDTVSSIPHSTKEAVASSEALVVMGGTTPGHSTDFVGAELAGMINADLFIIATNVDGVYTTDPREDMNAEMYKSISVAELLEKYGESWNAAGSNVIIDGPALKKIQAERIPTVVINGKYIERLKQVLSHQSFHGTRLVP